jgi:hypothetical protein
MKENWIDSNWLTVVLVILTLLLLYFGVPQ